VALNYKDRVKQTCTAPSGSAAFDFDVGGEALDGYQTFVAALADGDTTVYGAEDDNGGWEIGLGTWNESNNALTRTTIYASSNSGSAVTFSGAVTIFITLASQQLVTSPNWRDVDWSNFKLQNVYLQKYGEITSSPSITGGSITFDLNNGNVFLVSLNANITSITISNVPSSPVGANFTVLFTADGTQRSITWGSSIKFPANAIPTMSYVNNTVDIISFMSVNGGTAWYAATVGQGY
jgi:hypothetical protein